MHGAEETPVDSSGGYFSGSFLSSNKRDTDISHQLPPFPLPGCRWPAGSSYIRSCKHEDRVRLNTKHGSVTSKREMTGAPVGIVDQPIHKHVSLAFSSGKKMLPFSFIKVLWAFQYMLCNTSWLWLWAFLRDEILCANINCMVNTKRLDFKIRIRERAKCHEYVDGLWGIWNGILLLF